MCEGVAAETYRLSHDDFDDVLGIVGVDTAVVFEADVANAEGHRVGHDASGYVVFLATLSEQSDKSTIIAVEVCREVIVDVLIFKDTCEQVVVFGDDDTYAVGGIA